MRPLREWDLAEADRIFRLAFGTFIRLPDPSQFAAGCDFIRNRWRAAPDQTLGLEVDGQLAGSNLLTRWGTFGFFGSLTVRPDLWERGYQNTCSPRRWIYSRSGICDTPASSLFRIARNTSGVSKIRFLAASSGGVDEQNAESFSGNSN